MSWRPLLEGADADGAREAIAAIAADLATRTGGSPDLGTGRAGQALLHAYRAPAGDGEAHEQLVGALAAALDGLDQLPGPWFFDGLCGIAWTAAHLADRVDIDDDTFRELDAIALRLLSAEPWPFLWEQVAGLVGLGIYALERGDAGAAMRARIVAHLAALAERDQDGATWRSPPRPEDRERAPHGYHDLGLAHGVAGVIAFLTAAIDVPGAAQLLADSARWLLARDTGDPSGRFPYEVGRGTRSDGPRRDGWCYGDQAVAIALVRAGQVLSEPAWIERGASVARDVVGREPAPLEVSLCHGTLGRAHMFNRLAQATGSEELADAARVWYRKTIALRQSATGIGGYRSEVGPDTDGSLVLGATGVALGLIAAVTSDEPAWDRAFLLSAPASSPND